MSHFIGGVGKTIGNVVGSAFHNPLQTLADVATTIYAPELLPVVQGGGDLLSGKSLGTSLKDAALAYGGSELGGALGNAFPETLGGIFGTGGNSLTDLYGSTSGAGSLTGSGTLGGDIQSLGGRLGLDGSAVSSAGTVGTGSNTAAGGGSSSFGTGATTNGSSYSNLTGGDSYLPNNFSLGNSNLSGNTDLLGTTTSNGPLVGNAFNDTGVTGQISNGLKSSSGGGMFDNLLSGSGLKLLGAGASLGSNLLAQGQLANATGKANAALAPYTNTGSAAENQLGNYLGLNGGAGASSANILAASPGYQFLLDQGNQQLDRQQAARGGYFSGEAIKAGQDYASGLANQTAQQYYNNLANTANGGLSAANAMGNNTTALGTAQGSADINMGNQLAQLISGNSTYGNLLKALSASSYS